MPLDGIVFDSKKNDQEISTPLSFDFAYNFPMIKYATRTALYPNTKNKSMPKQW